MSEPEPYLKIVKGNVTPEEVAALVAAIAARTAPATQPVRKVDNWRNPAYRMRVSPLRGHVTWRTAFFPGRR